MSPLVTTVANSGARGRVPAPPGGNTPAGLIYSHNFEDGLFPSQGPVIQSGLTSSITVSTVDPIDGLRSLNFGFVAKPPGTDSWLEHNMALPKCYGGFGMEWDMRFPTNFALRYPGSTTAKWFQFWQQTDANAALNPRVSTDYGQIMQVGASFYLNQPWENKVKLMSVITRSNCLVCNDNVEAVLMDLDTPANGPIKLGQNHNIKWRVKYASGPLPAADGVYELLVDNVSVYTNNACAIWPYDGRGSTPPFVSWGYLMGYVNGGFGVETNIKWDNLRIYNTATRWW